MEQCFLSSKDKSVRYNTRDLCELACQVKENISPLTHIEQKETCNFRSLGGMEPAEVLPSGRKVARYISLIICKLNLYFSHCFFPVLLLEII